MGARGGRVGNCLLSCELRKELPDDIIRSQFAYNIVESEVGKMVQSKLHPEMFRIDHWQRMQPTS